MTTPQFPAVSKELIEALEQRWPNVIPTQANVSNKDFRRLQGRMEVINFLRYQYDQQNQTILENE